jgi:membrane protease YdiL (CAAX protease family)
MNTILPRLNAVAKTPPPWSLTTALIAVIVAFVFVIIGTLVGGAWFGDSVVALPPFAQLVGWLIAGVLTALYVLQTRRAAPDRAAMRMTSEGVALPLVIFIAFGAAIAIDLIAVLLAGGVFAPAPELIAFDGGAGFREWAVAITLMVAVQPVADGLLFRGVLLPSLRSALGGIAGIVAQAVIYAAFHYLAFTPVYAQGGFVPWSYGLLAPLLEGIVLGVVRVLTGSTRASIAAHIAFGIFAIAKLIVIVT